MRNVMRDVSKYVLSVSVSLSACATMESPNTVSSEHAPKGYNKGKTSTVVYNPQGLSEVVRIRREDAFKVMFEFCGSKNYEILSEKTVDASEVTETQNAVATMGADELNRIEFKCL